MHAQNHHDQQKSHKSRSSWHYYQAKHRIPIFLVFTVQEINKRTNMEINNNKSYQDVAFDVVTSQRETQSKMAAP